MTLVAALLALALPALLIVAAVKDLTSYTIPNWISLGVAAAFLPAALAVGLTLPAIGLHLAVGAGMLLVSIGLFAVRVIGGGDAKLLAAAALWMGLPALSPFVLMTAVAGGALSLTILLLRRAAFQPMLQLGPPWVVRLADPKAGVPYGVAIAAGALLAFPQSPFLASLLAL